MTYLTFQYAMMKYFEKYRGAVSGMLYAGETANSLVFPMVLLQLQYAYGFRNVLFIYGAIAMHTTVLCLLLRNRASVTQPHKTKAGSGSVENLEGFNHPVRQCEIRISPSTQSGAGDSLAAMNLFRNPMFYVSLSFAMSVHVSLVAFATTVVDYAMDRGCSLGVASTIIVYTAPADILGRVVVPLFADWKLMQRTTLILCCYIVMSASLFALPYSWSFWTFTLVCLCLCLSLGCLLVFKLPFVADHFDINWFAFCVGLQGVFAIPLTLGCTSITGECLKILL